MTTNNATIAAFQAGANVYDLEALSAIGVDALDAKLDGLIPLVGTTIYENGGGHWYRGHYETNH